VALVSLSPPLPTGSLAPLSYIGPRWRRRRADEPPRGQRRLSQHRAQVGQGTRVRWQALV